MMEYLKDYNINDNQINRIIDVLDKNNINIDLFKFSPEKIIAILEIFKSYGITNYYEIIITSPSLFCDTVTSIKNRLDRYKDKSELATLINEDANNLNLVGLM